MLINFKLNFFLFQIIAGRHLAKCVKTAISPFVEVELLGADYDYYKGKTSTISEYSRILNIIFDQSMLTLSTWIQYVHTDDNGLNPIYDETFVFNVNCPDLAFLRFVVYDVDMFGDSSFLAQATYPFSTLRCGYRSVKLKNEYSEDFELAALLVHLKMKSLKVCRTYSMSITHCVLN